MTDSPPMKTCPKCQVEKPRTLEFFYRDKSRASGMHLKCKRCVIDASLARSRADPERARENGKAWRQANRKRVVEGRRKRREEHRLLHPPVPRQRLTSEQRRESERLAGMRWRQGSHAHKLRQSLDKRHRSACIDMARRRTALEWLSCTGRELVAHFEAAFLPGMSWVNRADWDIDHILPLAAFDLTDERQAAVAFHHSNLRPLWRKQNREKWNSMPEPISAALSDWRQDTSLPLPKIISNHIAALASPQSP